MVIPFFIFLFFIFLFFIFYKVIENIQLTKQIMCSFSKYSSSYASKNLGFAEFDFCLTIASNSLLPISKIQL
jgi:Na+/H+ antiporter NhaC